MWRKPNESARPGSSDSPSPNTPTQAPSNIGEVGQSVTQSPVAQTHTPLPPAPASSPTSSQAASRISSGIKINGQISGNADLLIDGSVKGSIRLPGARLTVGQQGHVEADLEAAEVFVEGAVNGNVKAADKAHFGPASRTKGSILAPRLGIQEGAKLSGKVDMTAGPISTASVASTKPSSAATVISPAPAKPEPAPATVTASPTATTAPASSASGALASAMQRQTKNPATVGAGTEK